MQTRIFVNMSPTPQSHGRGFEIAAIAQPHEINNVPALGGAAEAVEAAAAQVESK